MAHRGRLNVLVNVLGKSPGELFSEFEGSYDVSAKTRLRRRQIPPGLLVGCAHARRQRAPGAGVQSVAPGNRQSGGRGLGARPPGAPRRRDRATRVMPVLIHGDAAFAGQGVVMETLQMSQTRGFAHRRHGAHRHQQPDRLHHQRSAAMRARRCTAATWPR